MPEAFYAIKATTKPLASTRRLRMLFLGMLVVSIGVFAALCVFFYAFDTEVAIEVSNTRLDLEDPDWSCEILSAMPSRVVRYPCLRREGDGVVEASCSSMAGNPYDYVFPNQRPFVTAIGAEQDVATVNGLELPHIQSKRDRATIDILYMSPVFYESQDACLAEANFSAKYCGTGLDRRGEQRGGAPKHVQTAGDASTRPCLSDDGNTVFVGDGFELRAIDTETGELRWAYAADDLSSPIVSGGIVYVVGSGALHAVDATSGAGVWMFSSSSREGSEGGSGEGSGGGSEGGWSSPIVSSNGRVVYVCVADDLIAVDAFNGLFVWSYPTGGLADRSSPSINADGSIVYIGDRYILHAVDASSGILVWALPINVTTSSSVGNNGNVYVGGANGTLHAVSGIDGTPIWTYYTADVIFATPTVSGDIVYVRTTDAHLHAVNASTGSRVWTTLTSKHGWMAPPPSASRDGHVVYVSGADFLLYAIDAAAGAILWTYNTGGEAFVAVGVDGTVYAASGVLYIIKPVFILQTAWTYDTNIRTGDTTSPAISGDKRTVYIGALDLHAIDLVNGTARWTYKTGGAITSSPAVSADSRTVYIGGDDNKLHAVDAATGKFRWMHAAGETFHSSPIVDGRVVYVINNDNYLYAIDGTTGILRWKYMAGWAEGVSIISSPVVGADTIYVSSLRLWFPYADSKLDAVDAATGRRKWTYATSGFIESSPAIGDNGRTVYVVIGEELHAVDAVMGTFKWRYMAGNRWPPAVSGDGQTIYVGSNAMLHAVDASTGRVRWTLTGGATIRSSPTVGDDGTTVYINIDSSIYAADAQTGATRWVYKMGREDYSSLTVSADGRTVYINSGDGKLYVIEAEARMYQACAVTQLTEPLATFVGMELMTAAEGGTCVEDAWQCASAPPAAIQRLQETFCRDYATHPPYTCRRTTKKGIVEVISLSFSFGELAYTIMLFCICRILWRKFNGVKRVATVNDGFGFGFGDKEGTEVMPDKTITTSPTVRRPDNCIVQEFGESHF